MAADNRDDRSTSNLLDVYTTICGRFPLGERTRPRVPFDAPPRRTSAFATRASQITREARVLPKPSSSSSFSSSNQTKASPTFTNADIYAFERELAALHPDNRHIRDKIRQQLQVLRDTGFLVQPERGVRQVK